MKDLFYSVKDKRLFFIAGYTDNSSCVSDILKVLNENTEKFIKKCNLPQNSVVYTDYVTQSRHYKSMRYFWVNDIETPPKDAYALGDDWTMMKWINN